MAASFPILFPIAVSLELKPVNRRPLRGVIRPKASNIPRRQTAANAHLEAYKLAIEKERLERELATIEDRKQQILQRLSQIDSQCDRPESRSPQSDRSAPADTDLGKDYRTIAIDY